MKGVVFSEFNDLVEDKFGLAVLDRIIEKSELPNGGAYTAVGTYDHRELLRMVGHLQEETGVPVPQLAKVFGRHLFGQLVASHPKIVQQIDNVVGLLANVERVIHVEVRKLYPDAELPRLDYRRIAANECEITYYSKRPFADVAHGLIEGAADHFGERCEIEREDLNDTSNHSRFLYRCLGPGNA